MRIRPILATALILSIFHCAQAKVPDTLFVASPGPSSALTGYMASPLPDLRKPVRSVPCADYEASRIVFPGADTLNTAWEEFLLKLDTLLFTGGRSLNVVHIGGSHVQGGHITASLRSCFGTLSPRLHTAPGLVFPFSAARSNTPVTYKSSYSGTWTSDKCTRKTHLHPLGMSGMAVSTADTSASLHIVALDRIDSTCHSFSRVRVIAHCSDSVQPGLRIRDSIVLGQCDSLLSLYEFQLPEAVDSIDIVPVGLASGREFTMEGAILDTPGQPSLNFHSIGVNGASLVSYSRCERLADEIGLLEPDLVIFEVGINDASGPNFNPETFIGRYSILIEKFMAANPRCALLFITNNDSCRRTRKGYFVNANGPIVRDSFMKIAAGHEGGVWDLFTVMGGLKSVYAWQKEGLVRKDKVHFTAEGYALVGRLLYNAMIEQYEDHLKRCKIF